MAEEQKAVDQGDISQGIAVAEFEYIAQTAFQAHEDRARVSEFFLISFGTLLAAVLTTQLTDVDTRLVYRLVFDPVHRGGTVGSLDHPAAEPAEAGMAGERAGNEHHEGCADPASARDARLFSLADGDNTQGLQAVERWFSAGVAGGDGVGDCFGGCKCAILADGRGK